MHRCNKKQWSVCTWKVNLKVPVKLNNLISRQVNLQTLLQSIKTESCINTLYIDIHTMDRNAALVSGYGCNWSSYTSAVSCDSPKVGHSPSPKPWFTFPRLWLLFSQSPSDYRHVITSATTQATETGNIVITCMRLPCVSRSSRFVAYGHCQPIGYANAAVYPPPSTPPTLSFTYRATWLGRTTRRGVIVDWSNSFISL